MKKKAKFILIVFSIIFFVAALFILRPVPIVSEGEAITENGILIDIYGNSSKDIIFILKNNPTKFYINRGLENGLEIENLKEKLIGKTINVKYPRQWTPLDWNNSGRHISKLEYNGEVFFNELK